MLLMHYTSKGAEHIRDSPDRIDSARKTFRTLGGNLKQWPSPPTLRRCRDRRSA
jgi:uncharacterized protein with GYD domain